MEIIQLNEANIEQEHICCAFSDRKSVQGTEKKKAWLRTAFQHGYSFRKLDTRGKVFIEYGPIEQSWLPLEGGNFMVVNCFWVSGKFKGKGYGKALLNQCIADAKAKGMDGVIAVSSDKKRPFMSDPNFFRLQGFEVTDEAAPFFQLYGMRWNADSAWPRFLDTARTGTCPDKEGISVYFSNTCPFTEYWVREALPKYAASKGVPIVLHHLGTQEEARKMPVPWVINSVFFKGDLVTLEVKPDRHLDKLISG